MLEASSGSHATPQTPAVETMVARLLENSPPATQVLRLPPPVREAPAATAAFAGLSYASPEEPGVSRRRSGRGFVYERADGSRVKDRATLARIRALAIPPAWRRVWISPDPNGHLQAMGYDEKGRRQYRYHARFRELREHVKYQRLIAFAETLPLIRARVEADMARPGRRQVLATVVHLLETTMIRVGNRSYARDNHSFGLTTLEPRHLQIAGTRLRFSFTGKSGKAWRLDIRDKRIVRILKTCQELPGQSLFRYVDEVGEAQSITSVDVNDYLREISGADFTAKDFRTWNGTVLAATELAQAPAPQTARAGKHSLAVAIRKVAAQLHNTPAVCRACYVHPAVVDAFLAGDLRLDLEGQPANPWLSAAEMAVLSFVRARAK
ncbi:MAG TPA: DNA topoisomerase IB [Caulobacteraceae bacterium]|jgi:DNA topoisomerase-1